MRIQLTVVLCTISLAVVGQAKPRESLDASATAVWDLEPGKITPGHSEGRAPSDAVVLFDGRDLSKWTSLSGDDTTWAIDADGVTVKGGAGDIKTKQKFGDVQLHIEWRSPAEIRGEGQGRGNSGIYLQERYEVQVLDSYENRTYSNGQAGAIFKQAVPLVNASRKPGEWQVFDIIYTAPRFSENGRVSVLAYMTVFHNGVLIHNHVPIQGPTEDHGLPVYKVHDKASLLLQDHGDAVSYRNIWIREL